MRRRHIDTVFAWLGLGLAVCAPTCARAQDTPPNVVSEEQAPGGAPAPPPDAGANGVVGCLLQGVGPGGPGSPQPLKTTGDAALDNRMSADLERIGAWFRVLPRLYFFDDRGKPNAFSTSALYGEPDDFPPERSQFGTVLFGIALLQTEVRSTPPGQQNYTIAAILAHELGHTLQAGRNNPLPVVHKELQADFMAGWAIRFMQRNGSPDVDEGDVFSTFYKKGDFEFNNADHHGTRKERLSAFLAGYDVEDDDVNVAYAKGDEYVRSIPLQIAREFLAKNLGMYYVALGNPDGTFGLRISRPPAADSPVGRGGLEAGDVILTLDELPIRTPADVANHTGRTTVSLIDVRTGQRQETVIELP